MLYTTEGLIFSKDVYIETMEPNTSLTTQEEEEANIIEEEKVGKKWTTK